MFGYIVANRAALSEEEIRRYRACYCGLCRSLRLRHGSWSRLTISYDMTFVAMLLGSLYEPEGETGRERCVTHPTAAHEYYRDIYTDYAADMNIALTYHKCLDDWKDERKRPQYYSAKLLQEAYGRVREAWPRQCGAIEGALDELDRLEKASCAQPDMMANIFGDLMAELFVYEEDNWRHILRDLGGGLGVFIYIMDACCDMERDIKKGLYNPLLAFAAQNGGVQPEQDAILTMLMGDAAAEFEKLPLLRDIGILRNIIYSGVWQQYNAKQNKLQKKKEEEHGSN